MRVLMTGATGFIGSALAHRLASAGHEVIGLTRDPVKAGQRVPEVEAFHAWDPENEPAIDLLASADAVVNLAGESVAGRWTQSKKARIYESRIVGTRNLVSAMAKAGGPKVLVNASAVGFYGDRGDERLAETAAMGSGFLADVCHDWEAQALEGADNSRVVVMRTGVVLGSEGGALKTMLPLFRFGLGGPLGNGKQWWPWVHVDDAVSAFTAAVEQPFNGVYNLAAPTPARQGDFAGMLGKVLHRPAFLPVPGFALRLVQGEFADEVLFSKRVIPARLESEGFRFQHADLNHALSAILTPEASLEDVLAEA